MSTILDALEKLERAGEAGPPRTAPGAHAARRSWAAAALLLAFAAGAGLALWLGGGSPPASVGPTAARVAADPVAEAPAPPPAERPRVAPAPAPAAAPEPPAAVAAVIAPAPSPTLETPPEEAARAEAPVLPRPPADAPRVRLSFLVYSRDPERRSAALAIDGGSLVTLREGESAGDLTVARIFADRVHLRRGREVFTVHARE